VEENVISTLMGRENFLREGREAPQRSSVSGKGRGSALYLGLARKKKSDFSWTRKGGGKKRKRKGQPKKPVIVWPVLL